MIVKTSRLQTWNLWLSRPKATTIPMALRLTRTRTIPLAMGLTDLFNCITRWHSSRSGKFAQLIRRGKWEGGRHDILFLSRESGGIGFHFFSQAKMMRHASMNNFPAIDIHTLTNGKSYGNVGNGFISLGGGEKYNTKGWLLQLHEKWHVTRLKSDSEA